MQWDIRRFDIYRKIPKDLTEPTRTGACISVLSITFILYLIIAEFMAFITPQVMTTIVVDDPKKAAEMIPVKLRITMYNISCDYLGIDIQDDVGRHEVGHTEDTERHPINGDRGCYLYFSFNVNKVSGNFHVSTHGARRQPEHPDYSHTIHELSIGDQPPAHLSVAATTTQTSFSPLNNRTLISKFPTEVYDHYLKIVPSTHLTEGGSRVYPYQYTVMTRVYNTLSVDVGAAIWFRYDLLPITVQYHTTHMPFYHFLTYICGVVGGTFTVAGIIDSMIFSATQLYKKAEIGKLT